MKRILFSLVVLLLWASTASAQYNNTPRIESNSGDVITFMFWGVGVNEKPARYSVPSGLTPQETFTRLREWIGATTDAFNQKNTVANVAALEKGKTVTGLPAPVVTPTAAQLWLAKVRDLENAINVQTRLTALGTMTGAFATAITNLGSTTIPNLRTAVNADFNNADAQTKASMILILQQ